MNKSTLASSKLTTLYAIYVTCLNPYIFIKMDVSDDDNMAAIMGFSSFSEMPKPKRQRVDEESSKPSSNNPNEIPLGKRNRSQIQGLESAPISGQSNLHTLSISSESADQVALPLGRPSTIGNDSASQVSSSVTSDSQKEHPILEKTLDELTYSDLQVLRHGIRAADGRTIYFSKAFIEDPWERMKKR
jgi:hypothetical protein